MKPGGPPKRTPAQRVADDEFIARQRVRGKTLTQIAKLISEDPDRPYTLSYPMVRKDAERITKTWQANAAEFIKVGKERTMATLDEVEAAAWLDYENSQKDRTVKRLKKRELISESKKEAKDEEITAPPATIAESTIQSEARTGDPAYLAIILSCAEKRARLMGVEAPQKVQMTDAAGAPVPMLALSPIIRVMLPEGTHDPFHAISIPGISPVHSEASRN